ncbi:MAG: methylmalonyl-CoA mutase family protein, partial [Acidimicrobiales bacterium]
LQAVKVDRDGEAVERALASLKTAAADPTQNLMPHLVDTVKTYATLGEISNTMATVLGRYVETPFF